MSSKIFDCRFCGGERQHNGTLCLGCGSPVQNALNRNRPAQKKGIRCPRCNSHQRHVNCDGTSSCTKCGAWYDHDNEGMVAVDDRPVQNAMKRERRQRKVSR